MAEPGALHEDSRDIDAPGIGRGLAVIVAGIAFSLGAAWLFSGWTGNRNGANNVVAVSSKPSPSLRSAPLSERAAYFRGKEQRLREYGRIERTEGRAHIPIEEAMDLLVRQAATRDAGGRSK